MKILRGWLVLVVALGLSAGSAAPLQADPLPPLRRVNAPYFPGGVLFKQSAIFWFGQANPLTAYADVRIGYDPNQLFVHVAVFDRLLWHATNPTSNTVTNWDSVTLYLNKTGPTGSTLNQAYRFDGEADAGGYPRTGRQAEYYGSGTSWTIAPAPTFTTEADWAFDDASGGFNNGQNNRGYYITFHLPYASLGLSGPPATGTVWGLAVAVHNRDYAPPAAMQPDEFWPEAADVATPSTWGQLYFGTPAYTPQSGSPGGIVTIRNGLNGAVVTEAPAGGHVVCGEPKDNYWTDWGNRVVSTFYAGTSADPTWMFNVQNQQKVADWLCFSKYYTTFPLTMMPPGKVVISAALAMNEFGNTGAGYPDQPTIPSYIQVLTVGQDWTPNSLTWNNAPLARENVAMTPVDPLNGAPAVWRTWDVSRAVAEAYSAGQPLRLAIYAGDWDYHSGRYFRPSAYPDAQYRPTLTVRWGDPLATIYKRVTPVGPKDGQSLTYTLNFLGSGSALTLTDSLPPEVGDPAEPIQVQGGAMACDGARQITCTGSPSVGQPVTVTFSVAPVVSGTRLIRNSAVLADSLGHVSADEAIAILDPFQVWLSLIRR